MGLNHCLSPNSPRRSSKETACSRAWGREPEGRALVAFSLFAALSPGAFLRLRAPPQGSSPTASWEPAGSSPSTPKVWVWWLSAFSGLSLRGVLKVVKVEGFPLRGSSPTAGWNQQAAPPPFSPLAALSPGAFLSPRASHPRGGRAQLSSLLGVNQQPRPRLWTLHRPPFVERI